MFHFMSCEISTNLLLRISFFVYHFLDTKSSILKRNRIKTYNLSNVSQESIIFKDIDNIIPELSLHGFTEIGTLQSQLLRDFSDTFNSFTFYEDLEPQYLFQEGPDSSKRTGRFFADPSSLSKNSVISDFTSQTILASPIISLL